MFRGIIGGPKQKKSKPFVRRVNLPKDKTEEEVISLNEEDDFTFIYPEEITLEEETEEVPDIYPNIEETKFKKSSKKKSRKRKKSTVVFEPEE